MAARQSHMAREFHLIGNNSGFLNHKTTSDEFV
jgi:hypothetical protein